MIYKDIITQKRRENRGYLVLYLIAMLTIITLIGANSVFAASENLPLGISISPSLIEIRTKSIAPLSQPITIRNLSNQDQAYTLELRQLTSSIDGTYRLDKSNSKYMELFNNISFIENNSTISSLKLTASEQKKLILRINLTKDLIKKNYSFAVIVKSIADISPLPQSQTMISYGTGSIVLLSTSDQTDSKLEIKDFSTSFFKSSGPIQLRTIIQNQGKSYTKVLGTVSIQNMFGKVIARSDIMPMIILPDSKKELTVIESSGFKNNKSDQESYQSVQWNDSFLFGAYTAQLSISGTDNTLVTSRILFIALPIYTLIPLIIFALLAIRFYLRVKRKLV